MNTVLDLINVELFNCKMAMGLVKTQQYLELIIALLSMLIIQKELYQFLLKVNSKLQILK